MTARHQIRVGGRRLSRDRGTPIDATPAPSLGEILRLARERKGVDLYRAERDTKIRAKHLEALENDEYGQLPGQVYTKGFLRNYAVYLGLDPEETLAHWRDETSATRRSEAVAVAPPRPLAEPRRGLIFTRGVLVAALISFVMLAFLGYVVLQVARFSQATQVAVDPPLVRQIAEDAETTVIAGTAVAGATVTVTGPVDFLRTTEADAAGRWSMEVPVSKGRNEFQVVAADPETERRSSAIPVSILVPVPPTPSPSDGPPGTTLPRTALTISTPAEGADVTDGMVTVSGSTDATSVTVTAEPAEDTPTPSGEPGPSTAPGSAAPAPEPVQATVTGGTYTAAITLSAGSWTVTVSASSEGHEAAMATRAITVAFEGLSVTVEAERGNAYLQVWVDARPAEGWNPGRTLRRGESVTFVAEESVLVRTGNSGATVFTVNGQRLGALGDPGDVENWLFQKGKPPQRRL